MFNIYISVNLQTSEKCSQLKYKRDTNYPTALQYWDLKMSAATQIQLMLKKQEKEIVTGEFMSPGQLGVTFVYISLYLVVDVRDLGFSSTSLYKILLIINKTN